MGAYTQAAGSSFNGFASADIRTLDVFSSLEGKARAAGKIKKAVKDAPSFDVGVALAV